MLGRGRRGVQGLEHLGPESAENLYSRPRQCRGNTEHVLSSYGGKETYIRCFFGEEISRVGGAGPRTRGSTGFGTFWGLKVLKTSTPPRARGNVGEYRSCAVFVWWEGNLLPLLLRRSNKQGWGCWAADAGGVQVLEHLGSESAENLYSPACPR